MDNDDIKIDIDEILDDFTQQQRDIKKEELERLQKVTISSNDPMQQRIADDVKCKLLKEHYIRQQQQCLEQDKESLINVLKIENSLLKSKITSLENTIVDIKIKLLGIVNTTQ